MADLSFLLIASLNHETRKQAEQALSERSTQVPFIQALLELLLNAAQDRNARLAASVYLKNIAKTRWDDDAQPLSEDYKMQVRKWLIPAMLALSNPMDKTIRTQLAESVSLIAALDFPNQWPDLVDELANLSPGNYNANTALLETAHFVFRPWRSQVRSDALYTVINLVLSKFMDPFLNLFRDTSKLLLSFPPTENYSQLALTLVLLLDIFYDLTCQDLPPAIEDNSTEFFGDNGWFSTFLDWDPVELRQDPEDPAPSLPAQAKIIILEIAELFIKLYPEILQKSSAVPMLIRKVWVLIGEKKSPNVSDDLLASQALSFISTAIHSGYYNELFSSQETIQRIVEDAVIPNILLREHEIEQFEDDPLEYIRIDLASSSTGLDNGSRRQAAASVLRSLVSAGHEVLTTEIVSSFIMVDLNVYQADKINKWTHKDRVVFMMAALATKGMATKHGVTSTNPLVNVADFFLRHVYQDLEASEGSIHPILQVDSIRYLYTFRNQLTKEQLLKVFPYLIRHLKSDNYVIHTYAAIAIDRILLIKQNGRLLFSQTDIHEYAHDMVNIILSRILSAGSPEKMAENDHFMRCAMRVILTARQSLAPRYQEILARLIEILGHIAKNPSNPNFDQYIFESISGLMRFVVEGSPVTLPYFEQQLLGPLSTILQQDIDQYIPYTFQMLAQMLQLHSGDAPSEYYNLLPNLFLPAVWQQKGSIPGLVKLLKAYLARGSAHMVANGQVTSVLAVVQQRLIPSKINDSWGFELLNSVLLHVKPDDLKQYMVPVMTMLLLRLQSGGTPTYEYLFSRFILYAMALNVDGLGPDYIISVIESIQQGLSLQLLLNFIIPQAVKAPNRDRKVVVVGLIRLLCQSKYMMEESWTGAWQPAHGAIIGLFRNPEHLSKKTDEDPHAGITEIDYEEQNAGYQAAYSRLAASETQEVDPVAYVSNPQQFFQEQFENLNRQYGNRAPA